VVESSRELDPGGRTRQGARPVDVACTPAPADAPAPTLADRLLDGSDHGILACDDRGVVQSANTAARTMLPGLRIGELLVGPPSPGRPDPGVEVTVSVDFTVGDRRISARTRALPDGWTAWFLSDVTEQHSRMDSLLAERARSRFLATASRRLGLSLHPGRTARAVVELATSVLADAAAVVWPAQGSDDRVEWVAGERGSPPDRSGSTPAGEVPAPVLDALRGVETDPRPLLLDDLAGVPWLDLPGADGHSPAPVAGVGVVTLPGNGVPAGALVLLRRGTGGASASAGDDALLEEFAQRAGIALAAAELYAQQVRTTGVLRSSLVQPPLPRVPGVVFGAAYRPSDQGLLIGGDFYDVLPRPGAATTFLLGDVCGKGVDAAVSTGRVRQSVLALRRLVDDPVRLLDLLNATMLETEPDDGVPRFVTLVLGTTAPRPDGGVTVQLAGGGHLSPLVVRRGGGVEPVDIGGMLVGAVPDARFGLRTVDLAPGESCVLYSDGVTEAHGGVDGRQPFGEERLAELLQGCDVLPAPGIAERVVQHATAWLGDGHHDDIAVLVVQAPLPVRRSPRHLHSVAVPTAHAGLPPSGPPTRAPEETP
jgi:serine phosphatase RsbU (regulator of sigma subunit)